MEDAASNALGMHWECIRTARDSTKNTGNLNQDCLWDGDGNALAIYQESIVSPTRIARNLD